MKNYKYFRVLVCLLLVCALIISISPIKARAVGVEWILRQIATDIGVTAILEGLGLFRDTLNGDEYYNNLVSDVKDAAANSGFATLDYIDAYYQVDPLGIGSPLFAVPASLINFVRSYLFTESVVYVPAFPASSLVGTGYMGYSSAVSIASKCDNCFTFYVRNDPAQTGVVAFDSAPSAFVYDSDTLTLSVNCRISPAYVWYWDATSFRLASNISFSVTNALPVSSHQVITDQPITLGFIPPPDTLFEAAYEQWTTHEIVTEDGITQTYVQIGLGNTLMETESLSQEQIWSGAGTISVPSTDSGSISGTLTLPSWVQDGINNLLQGLKDIINTLLSLPAAIAKAIWEALPSWLQEGISSLKTGLLDILDSIASLPVAIAEALVAVFVPSADYISVKVEALRGEFGFIDSVIATGEFIRDSVSGASGPPVIYVDLGRASSGNYGSQRVLLTDFSWYAPYKGQVDTVLSAALWAFFGWRVFLKLPGIIGGESGYISDVFFPSSSGRSGSDDKKKGGKG